MTPHLILDFETLSQDASKCVVLDCSYVIFDWDRFTTNPYSMEELVDNAQRYKFDVEDQVENHGWKISKSTLQFWNDQGVEARKVLNPSTDDISVELFINEFEAFLESNKPKYWWSRSNTFDPIIIFRMIDHFGKTEKFRKLLPFWMVRDTRSFIDGASMFGVKNDFIPIKDESKFVKHSSRHDIAMDILRLQTLTRFTNGMEIDK